MTGSDTPERNDDGEGAVGKGLAGGVNWQQSPLPRSSADGGEDIDSDVYREDPGREDSRREDSGPDNAMADEPGHVAADRRDWDDEPEQLALADEDVSLPWLEGDADEPEYAGYSAGHILGLVLLGLVVLGLIVGGIWYATRAGGGSDAVVADGSTIEAPETPYKERPEDPGGKTFEGTGDTSFAVSQGQTRPARLGEEGTPSGAAATPGFDSVTKGAAPAAGTAAAAASAAPVPAASGVGVQVGAFSTREAAEAGWTRLTGLHSALAGVKHRVVEGQADIGKVYRLQAVPGDVAAAKALCATLKAAGQACQVKN